MSSPSSLPLIVVSAKTRADASAIISELLQDNSLAQSTKESHVWHIFTKYYDVEVAVQPVSETDPVPSSAEGHLIYLAEDECTAEIAEHRANAIPDAEVCVLAADTESLSSDLIAWAARRRYEPVALREDVTPDPCGVAAVRAALHAHVWPGLTRIRNNEPDSEDDEDGEDEEWDAEAATRWAEALESLSGSAAAVRELPPAERREAAEDLVGKFAQALGLRLEDL